MNVSNCGEGKGRRNQKRRQFDIEGNLWIEIVDKLLRFKMECHCIRNNTICVNFTFSIWYCFLFFCLCLIVYKTCAIL